MTWHLPKILVFSLLLSMGCSERNVSTPSDAGVESWDALHTQLLDAVPEVLPSEKGPHDYTFNIEPMQRVRDNGSLELWLEMCQLHDFPMVATGGYLCVVDRAPESRFEAAWLVVAHRSDGASLIFYYPAIQFLAEQVEPTESNFAELTRCVQLPAQSDEHMQLALALLPEEFVAGWIEAEDISGLPAAIQATAVDTAVISSMNSDAQPSQKVQDLLRSFAATRDSRLAVWLRHAPADADRDFLQDAVEYILTAEDIDEGLYFLSLRDHLGVVRRVVEAQNVTLTEEQRKRVDRLLKRDEDAG